MYRKGWTDAERAFCGAIIGGFGYGQAFSGSWDSGLLNVWLVIGTAGLLFGVYKADKAASLTHAQKREIERLETWVPAEHRRFPNSPL